MAYINVNILINISAVKLYQKHKRVWSEYNIATSGHFPGL